MVVRKAIWNEKGERTLKQGSKSERDRYANLRNRGMNEVKGARKLAGFDVDEGLGQVCKDCGHYISLSDVTGQYKGQCAKCREEEQIEKDARLQVHRWD